MLRPAAARPLLPLLLGLLLAGCGGGGADGEAAPSAPTAPSETAGTGTGSTGTPGTGPAGSAAEASPGKGQAPGAATSPAQDPAGPAPGAAPSTAPGEPALDGDVDGDGEVDEVSLAAGDLTVTLSGGGTTVASVTLDEGPGEVAGVVDGDGDGRAEVWVTTASGASTTFLTPFRLVDGGLREVTTGGQAVRLGLGGTATHGNGFACDRDAGTLTVTEVESADGSAYRGTATTYRWSGATLVPVGKEPVEGGPDDEAVAAGFVVACGSLGE